jgi:predicted nucleotidyltransferase
MTEAKEINVKSAELAEVRRILRQYLPGCEVQAFGSRVTGQAKPWSDLDLAVVGRTTIHWNDLGKLTEAFQESDLPFRVEVMDWHSASPAFQEVISERYVVVQSGEADGTAR